MQPFKKSKCNAVVLKEKLLVKKKKKGNTAPSGSAVVLNGQLPARRNAPGWREVSDLYDKQHTVSQSAHSISVSK